MRSIAALFAFIMAAGCVVREPMAIHRQEDRPKVGETFATLTDTVLHGPEIVATGIDPPTECRMYKGAKLTIVGWDGSFYLLRYVHDAKRQAFECRDGTLFVDDLAQYDLMSSNAKGLRIYDHLYSYIPRALRSREAYERQHDR